MRKGIVFGLIPVGFLIAVGMGLGRSPARTYVALDRDARPLKDVFNTDLGKVRLLMYVSPTCGGCLRGAKQPSSRSSQRLVNRTSGSMSSGRRRTAGGSRMSPR